MTDSTVMVISGRGEASRWYSERLLSSVETVNLGSLCSLRRLGESSVASGEVSVCLFEILFYILIKIK